MLGKSRQSKANIEAFDFVLSELGKPAKMNMSSAINTKSNLTSKVFANIAASLDIATTTYETKFNLIDESLVRRRMRFLMETILVLAAMIFETSRTRCLE